MKKIVLHVSDEHVETVMTIVSNLKAGLIHSIESEGLKTDRQAAYAPKNGKIVAENERPSGKYVSASVYKSRLKRAK